MAKLGGGMPAWKGKFSEDDIEAVIAWFQSRWPEEVYQSGRSWTRRRAGG
jgi:mono/diheme cytochrome c family protein